MQRRSFLQTLGAASALSPFLATASHLTDKKIGLQLYTLRDDMGKAPEATLEALAKIGYKEVESAGYGNGVYYKKSPKEFKALLNGLGLTAPSGHYMTGAHNKAQVGTLLNGWEQAMADAAEVGQKYAVCAYLMPNERTKIDDYKHLSDLFNKSAEISKKYSIQFCYHNHDFEFQTLDGQLPYDVLLANTDKNLMKMELDLYWILKAGHDPLVYFKNHPGRFPLLHMKDMDKADKSFAEVGTGSIDFASILAHKKQAGALHYFVEQDVCKRPPLEAVGISYKNLSKMKF